MDVFQVEVQSQLRVVNALEAAVGNQDVVFEGEACVFHPKVDGRQDRPVVDRTVVDMRENNVSRRVGTDHQQIDLAEFRILFGMPPGRIFDGLGIRGDAGTVERERHAVGAMLYGSVAAALEVVFHLRNRHAGKQFRQASTVDGFHFRQPYLWDPVFKTHHGPAAVELVNS